MNTDKKTEFEKIAEGVALITKLMNEFIRMAQDGKSNIYSMPVYIYRGISKFYRYSEPNGKGDKHPQLQDLENDFIRSGLSLKIAKSISEANSESVSENGSSRIYYLSAVEHLINDAKRSYPDKYRKNVNDLDILAEIQHNGGATCLVDFSKSFLTALWFACCSDSDSDGFVYCYNVMDDIIVDDTLTVLKPEDERRQIRELLLQTNEETNLSSDTSARFYLWEPASNNSRIIRQDSVFVFGIEKFQVSKHSVRILKVESDNKDSILMAMNWMFNIGGRSIYNDPVGFAMANNKFSVDSKIKYSNITSYGHADIVNGYYESAMNFLHMWKGNASSSLSLKDQVEISFSLAVCYKKLIVNVENYTHHYRENAILEYYNVVKAAKKIIKKITTECPRNDEDKRKYEEEIKYYRKKCIRAMNGIVDLFMDTRQYEHAIKYCDTIIREMENGCLSNYENDELRPIYCKIEKMELLDLKLIQEIKTKKSVVFDNYVKKIDTYKKDIENDKGYSFFDGLLISYYETICKIFAEETPYSETQYLRVLADWRSKIETKISNKYERYIPWNFADMKQMIENIDCGNDENKKRLATTITSLMISFRDEFEMQNWKKIRNV